MPQTETPPETLLQEIEAELATANDPEDRAPLLNDWGSEVLAELDKKLDHARAKN